MIEEILVSSLIALFVGVAIYYLISRRLSALKLPVPSEAVQSIQRLETDVNTLKALLSRIPDANQLMGQINAVSQSLTDEITKFKKATIDEFETIRRDIVDMASRKALEIADSRLKATSVSKEDFDRLRERVESILGAEELAERMELLSTIFESADLRVLSWQCRLISILKGGLAPEAEEDIIISAGIPLTPARSFLKKLREANIVYSKRTEAYFLADEYMWIYSYIDDPDWLRSRLETSVKKEEEYRRFVRESIQLVEKDLSVVSEEFEVASGRIDLLCRDAMGVDLAIELKYPAATSASVGQLLRYREDYKRKTGMATIRTMLIAPKISDKLRGLLTQNQLEFREIPY